MNRSKYLLPSEGKVAYLIGMGGQHITPSTPPHPLPTMTKLEQHDLAMKRGGFSPYCGWILDGQQVTEQQYRNITDRADQAAEKGGALWS